MNAWQCFVCRGARGWRAGALSRVGAERSTLDRAPARKPDPFLARNAACWNSSSFCEDLPDLIYRKNLALS